MTDHGHHPVSVQPSGSNALYTFDKDWHQSLFGSFGLCPTSALACLCNPCYIAKLNNRVGEHSLTYCINPCSLMVLRTKVRTAFHIRGSLIEDCCVTTCCVCLCAAMQIDKELDYQNIPTKRTKHTKH